MKKNYFLAAILSFAMISMNAQFTDDMESYTDGSPISEGHWTDWSCGGGAGCAMMSSSAQAHGGSQSGFIPGDATTDAVLDLGNQIFGPWGLEFWMYIPAGKEGYFNFQGTVPVGGGTFPVGNIYFNKDGAAPGEGFVDYGNAEDPNGDLFSNFTYPEDQWFRIIANVNIEVGISTSTYQMYVDGVEAVAAGHPFASWDPNTLEWDYTDTLSFGGMDFYSISTNQEAYYDDFLFQNEYITLSTQDLEAKGFDAYKDRNNMLHLSANEAINNVAIYNMLGQEVYRSASNVSTVDMSAYANGTYIVKVNINGTEGSIKIVR